MKVLSFHHCLSSCLVAESGSMLFSCSGKNMFVCCFWRDIMTAMFSCNKHTEFFLCVFPLFVQIFCLLYKFTIPLYILCLRPKTFIPLSSIPKSKQNFSPSFASIFPSSHRNTLFIPLFCVVNPITGYFYYFCGEVNLLA